MMYQYDYQRPAVTADVVVWQVDHLKADLSLLLIKRLHDPFAGHWALPGGFVDANEDLADAAARELAEETHLQGLPLEQSQAVGTPNRDPRGWTITVVYQTLLPMHTQTAQAGSDAQSLSWHSLNKLPNLAFDHAAIIRNEAHRFYVSLQKGICSFLPDDWSVAQQQTTLAILERFLAQ